MRYVEQLSILKHTMKCIQNLLMLYGFVKDIINGYTHEIIRTQS